MQNIYLSFELKELKAKIRLCFNRVPRKVHRFGNYTKFHYWSVDVKVLPAIDSHFNPDSQTYLYFQYL